MEVKLRRAAEEIRSQLAHSDKKDKHYTVVLQYHKAKTILAFIDHIFPDWSRKGYNIEGTPGIRHHD